LIPPEWLPNITYFDDLENYIKKRNKVIAGGEYMERKTINDLAEKILNKAEKKKRRLPRKEEEKVSVELPPVNE
jgi:hypothetical protein